MERLFDRTDLNSIIYTTKSIIMLVVIAHLAGDNFINKISLK